MALVAARAFELSLPRPQYWRNQKVLPDSEADTTDFHRIGKAAADSMSRPAES